MTKFSTKDYALSAAQLEEKHSPYGDGYHPGYTRWDWAQAVAREGTLKGYWDWVRHMLHKEQEELDRDSPYTQGSDE